MIRFDYVRAATLEQAVRLINEPEYKNKLLSGGTDLLAYLHYEEPSFDRVVDISFLPDLKIIERRGDEIVLGAGVCYSEAAESRLLQESVPFLVEACRTVGSPQIRNLGTLGGNVVNAAACADSLPVLVCLDAAAHLSGAHGGRQVPVTELVLGPNHTQIEPGELLTHFSFKLPPVGVRTAFIKLGRRKAQSISRLTMVAMGRLDPSGIVDFMRITPGAATSQTVRFTRVEAMLLGKPVDAALFHAAAQQVSAEMIAYTGQRWSTEYKAPVVSTLAERVLTRVIDGLATSGPK
jgi:xanthine dehydrogenase FAD-binding subunit